MNDGLLQLRRIETSDDLTSARALAQGFGEWASEQIRAQLGIVPPDVDHPTHVLDDILESEGRLYIAEVDAQPAGIGGLKRLGPTAAEIKRMFVQPTTQRSGIGRAILQQLIDDAREIGCDTLYLESASFMHSAHALYHRAGFVPCDAYPGREFESSAHDVSLFMRLDLSSECPPSPSPQMPPTSSVAVP